MNNRNHVQLGRVAWLAYGPKSGKLVTLVDIIDHHRAVVDGPATGVPRQAVHFKQLRLTKFKLKVPLNASSKVVKKLWEKDGLSQKWKETSTAKKMEAKKLRQKLTDFDRFKLYRAKQRFNQEVRKEFYKLKAKARKTPVKPKPKPKKVVVKKGKK